MAQQWQRIASWATLAHMKAMNAPILPRKLPDHLLSQGVHTVDLPEVQRLCDLDYANARLAVARLTKERQLFSPVRGLYVVIPAQYRTWRPYRGSGSSIR